MAIVYEQGDLSVLAQYPPVRCDTHFLHLIARTRAFFTQPGVTWVSLGSVLEDVRNGVNVGTDLYSMDPTDVLYISVSQIKEHGLVTKNQNYLIADVHQARGFFRVERDMLLVTRSGTVGVALSSNHPSFELDDYTYVPSGFVITGRVKPGISADTLASYINLSDVQTYLRAMAAGACQRNISQDTLNELPVPESLLDGSAELADVFARHELDAATVVRRIREDERQLRALKQTLSEEVRQRLAAGKVQ